MLWLKAFHIIFVVTWFAGLFYLPRLFVYHSMTRDRTLLEQYIIMERRLFIMMTLGGVLSLAFGIALIIALGGADAWLWQQPWWHTKLALVILLMIYHLYCLRLMRILRQGENRRSHRWYRWYNELPTLFLIAIVLMVVVRPF